MYRIFTEKVFKTYPFKYCTLLDLCWKYLTYNYMIYTPSA